MRRQPVLPSLLATAQLPRRVNADEEICRQFCRRPVYQAATKRHLYVETQLQCSSFRNLSTSTRAASFYSSTLFADILGRLTTSLQHVQQLYRR